ncbi:hypothetical protein L1049_011495 [Liquidambar formosana]|uniref:Uncharacterized protein n=1 Tax=Liquidambar formosana TaxID=63359 RepID=A0AAP0RRW3_LIQFO
MDEQCDSETVSDPSFVVPGYDSKVTGEKRSATEFGENAEHARKRVKMRDLESVFRSEVEMSQVTEEPVSITLDAAQAERMARDTLLLLVDHSRKPLDLNTKVCFTNDPARDDSPPCAEDTNKLLSLKKHDGEPDVNTLRGTGLDLNVEDVSSSVNQDLFYPYKNRDHLKLRDVSECGSTTGPLEGKDPLRVWKEMKQNGFLSSSHGGIPVPKQRGRKSKNDVLKKKMEIAKREQVDRFTKIAAPSGLLNELNPGIINHVRNSKQVHSIIEALVRSERHEHGHAASKQASQLKTGNRDISDRKMDQENINDSGVNQTSLSHEVGHQNTLLGSRQTRGHPMSTNKFIPLTSEEKGGDADSSMVDKMVCGRSSCDSHFNPDNGDDNLTLKLSSSTTKASEIASSLSNEENLTSVSSLSVKAATVASQWLELLHQDIKGRLAALRRSKKRVRAVIHTELPFLLSKEFSSNQENDPYVIKNSAAGCSNDAIADMHRTRWSALFDQMEKALSEEEKQLESWSNQVGEMQRQCERGLQLDQWNTPPWLQHLRTSEIGSRSEKMDQAERELAVRAAAASIYSTCNFLLSMENVSCF